MAKGLSQASIEEKLGELDDWGSDGKAISKRFEFKNFRNALAFVNQIGELAEMHNHHPDIEFGWGYAHITFTTHDLKGLGEKDFRLAALVDEL